MWAPWPLKLPVTRLFVQQPTAKNYPYYWPFVMGSHGWPVDSLYKGIIMIVWNLTGISAVVLSRCLANFSRLRVFARSYGKTSSRLYPLYTGAATSVPPSCDHKTVQVAVEGRREAERLPWSFKGGTQDVQASPWTPWSPWSFEHVQNSRTKFAEEVGRSQVAQRRQDEGTHIAVVAEWMHSGRPLVAQLKMRTLCINLSDTSAFLVPPLCLLWTTNGVHWAITVATTVPPFSDHGNTWATMAMVLPSLCLLCATCSDTTTALVVQGRHKGRAAAVTQKQNFLGSSDHWAS